MPTGTESGVECDLYRSYRPDTQYIKTSEVNMERKPRYQPDQRGLLAIFNWITLHKATMVKERPDRKDMLKKLQVDLKNDKITINNFTSALRNMDVTWMPKRQSANGSTGRASRKSNNSGKYRRSIVLLGRAVDDYQGIIHDSLTSILSYTPMPPAVLDNVRSILADASDKFSKAVANLENGFKCNKEANGQHPANP